MTPDQASTLLLAPRPFLITFSGIDGAGKTTQIEHLQPPGGQKHWKLMLTCPGINWSDVDVFDSTQTAGTSGFPSVVLT